MPYPVSTPPAVADSRSADPGVIGQAVLRLLAQIATVGAVHVLSPRFRLVALHAEAFRTQAHVPGDKMQVRVGGMAFRTYTPLRLGNGDDVIELLGYVHGQAPAGRWLERVAPGDRCHVLGPRRSLDLAAIDRSTVFFGDETSLGLALALRATALGGLDTHFIFEVDDAHEARDVLEAMGRGMLRHAWLVARRPDDAHLVDVESALARYAAADSFRQYVLSGRAGAIQRLGRTLKRGGVKPSQMLVKAYWAPGKTALD
ncbi:MAG: siderophore-interacting protein [Betaproteobacteria bacterium]